MAMFVQILTIILAITGTLLVLVLAAGLAVVVVPFDFKSRLVYRRQYHLTLACRWLWGLVRVVLTFVPDKRLVSLRFLGIRVLRRPIAAGDPERKRKKVLKKAKKKEKKWAKRRKKREARQPQGFEGALDTLQSLSVDAAGTLIHFVVGVLASLKFEIVGRAEIGLSDPADTGMLVGFFHAIRGALQTSAFELRPNFEQRVAEGQVEMRGRLWILVILVITVRTLLRSAIRRIWWPHVRRRIAFL